jgi:hypothetical protein
MGKIVKVYFIIIRLDKENKLRIEYDKDKAGLEIVAD